MKFRRLTDLAIVDAKPWERHGDHPAVRPATADDLAISSDPSKYGWIDGCGIVLPGDWIVTDANGRPRVVHERMFRRGFEPSSDNT